MAFKIANAWVDVDYRIDEAEAKLKRSLAGLDATVNVRANTAQAEASLAGVASKARSVTVDADTAPLQRKLAALDARKVKVDADVTAAEAKLDGLRSSADRKIAEIDARKLKVDADTRQAELKLERLRSDFIGPLTRDETVRVEADTASAEARLAGLKARAESIGDARIRVDAEVAGAEAGLATVQARAEALGAQRATVQADADTASADAELAVTAAAVSGLDGRRANVSVDADVGAALAKIALVGAALAGLGPVLVGGVGAAAGVGAVVAAGIGSIGGSILGVGGAVKALGAHTAAAGGAASKAASNHLQMAAAIDHVRQAQAALANAQANSADQERRAAESVANARRTAATQLAAAQRQVLAADRDLVSANRDATSSETRLTDAQRAAKRAQDALTDARKAAARQLEDLQTRTEDMVLEQQGASLAVQQAKHDLDKVLADPRNTQLQRAEAQLTYDQAVQQQKDLGKQAQQLAEDKSDADKKGIDGSDAVVSAQDQLIAAQEAVANAIQAVTEAQEKQAASATRVALEQAQLVATHLEGEQKIADAVAAQASTQRQADFSIAQSKQQVVDAQRAVQQASIQAGSAGAAGAAKLRDAMKELSPEGQKFAKFLRGFIDGPIADLRKTGQNNLLPGLQRGLEALEPILDRRVTPAFGRFSKELGDDIGAAIPLVGELGADLLDFATSSLAGFSPLGDELRDFEGQLSDVFHELEQSGDAEAAMGALSHIIGAVLDVLPPLIEDGEKLLVALGPGLTAVVESLSQGVGSLADEFVAFAPTLNSILVAVAPIAPELVILGLAWAGLSRIGAITPLIDLAKGALSRWRGEAETATATTGGFQSALGKAALAITALQIANQAFGEDASVGVNEATKSLEAWIQSGESASDLTDHLDHDLGTLTGGFLGLKTAQVDVGKAVDALGLSFLQGGDSITNTNQRLDSLDAALADMVSNGNADQARDAFDKLTRSADEQGVTVDELKARFPQYAESLDGVSRKSGTAKSVTDQLSDAINRVTNLFLGARGAETSYYQAVDRTTQSLKDNGKTLDVHTEKGRANRQALDDQAGASLRYVKSLQDQGAPASAVQAALTETRTRLIAAAEKFGSTRVEAEKYAAKITGIPASASTAIKLSGVAAAIASLDNVVNRIAWVNGHPAVISVGADSGNVREDRTAVGARAGGGPVAKGVPYLVGEKRPELFVPDQNGTIIADASRGSTGAAATVPARTLSIGEFHAHFPPGTLDMLSAADRQKAARLMRDEIVKLEGAYR